MKSLLFKKMLDGQSDIYISQLSASLFSYK